MILRLTDILREQAGLTALFSDAAFLRETAQRRLHDGTEYARLTDSWEEVRSHFLTIELGRPQLLSLQLSNVTDVRYEGAIGLAAISEGVLYWLPRPPVDRTWDVNGRIETEADLSLNWELVGASLDISIAQWGSRRLELAVIEVRESAPQYLVDLFEVSRVEKFRLSEYRYFRHEGISDFWRSLVKGQIFETRHKETNGGKRVPQEQAALLLYNVASLMEASGKRVYTALRHLIAYSVMIRLDERGRWRHGHWTRLMETHTRFQADGISLLIDHFERSRNRSFLHAADRASQYLLSLSDWLDSGRWFLHDELEAEPELVSLGYHNLVESNAFGKSTSNTLCVNTHVNTLRTLLLMATHDQTGKYREQHRLGLQALRTVLSAQSRPDAFESVFEVYELGGRLARGGRVGRKASSWLTRVAGRSMLKAKARYPRLVMPNGFIERDLVASSLSQRYNLINLRDLMVHRLVSKETWANGAIDAGLAYLERRCIKRRQVDEPWMYGTLLEVFALDGKRTDVIVKLANQAYENGGFPVDLMLAAWTLNRERVSALISSVENGILPIPLRGGEDMLLVNPTAEPLAPFEGAAPIPAGEYAILAVKEAPSRAFGPLLPKLRTQGG